VSILAKILATKGAEVQHSMDLCPLGELEELARSRAPALCLASALRRKSGQAVRVIAEFKRASPSKGPIRPGAEPEPIVALYEAAGASAISVLTDEPYFDGKLEFLGRVKACSQLPVLRKDFIMDAYQVVEARAHGADAVLLIVAALDDRQLRELFQVAREWGMDALVEVHDEDEADRAMAIGAQIIGVNHRNLATFEIDLGLTARLSGRLGGEAILVGESGISTAADVEELGRRGAHAVLVGETLMRADDPGAALRTLRGAS
jgi:indole-3-glycerol phosphate synthase